MTVAYEGHGVTVHIADALDVLAGIADASVDAVVTDPPYNLTTKKKGGTGAASVNLNTPAGRARITTGGFMGRGWDDYDHFNGGFQGWCHAWATECLRVLKPGGHLLAFGGTRTWHRLACAIEDAGFEIRDSIAWLYGSGFPKSLDVSKAIDKRRTEDVQPAADVARWLVDKMEILGVTRRDICDHFEAENIAQQWTTHWVDEAVKPRVPRWEQWQELRRWLDLPDDMDAEVWRLNGRKGKPGDNFEGREVLSERVTEVKGGSWAAEVATGRFRLGEKVIQETAPATDAAREWEGWGTALKPAFEPVVVARKPLSGTVAQTVLEHGTGALNIDGCRVGETGATKRPGDSTHLSPSGAFTTGHAIAEVAAGRWPANVVLDEEMSAELDRQSGDLKSGTLAAHHARAPKEAGILGAYGSAEGERGYGDTGGASRFFPTFRYEAKAPTSERPKVNGVAHPTVKPVDLCRWLVRLVTPPGGVVLEPFAGSGTTVEACIIEGFDCIAIEKGDEYLPLIMQRIHRRRDPVAAIRQTGDELGLFDHLEGAP